MPMNSQQAKALAKKQDTDSDNQAAGRQVSALESISASLERISEALETLAATVNADGYGGPELRIK